MVLQYAKKDGEVLIDIVQNFHLYGLFSQEDVRGTHKGLHVAAVIDVV